MPLDYRRINGPEESVPYELFIRKSKSTHKDTAESKLPEASGEQRKICK